MTVHAQHGRWILALGLLAALFCQSALTAERDDPAVARPIAPEEAAAGVLRRVIPAWAGRFDLATIPRRDGADVFEVEAAGGRVRVRGSSGVAIASGVNWYLQNVCHCDVSWCGDQLRLPDPLPPLAEKVDDPPFAYRYFFNYCSFSYTMAWWDWPRWERMIDWMALHGINMPLAVTGQESVWLEVCRKLGLSDDETGRFLVGPAYLPFGWMGCIDGWGGPLPQAWIATHRDLERKILRASALGMTPVLQGFTGHVPAALKRKHPEAHFRQLPSWPGFPERCFWTRSTRSSGTLARCLSRSRRGSLAPPSVRGRHVHRDVAPQQRPGVSDRHGPIGAGRRWPRRPRGRLGHAGLVVREQPRVLEASAGPRAPAHLGARRPPARARPDCESDPAWKKTEAFFGKPWIFCIIQTFGDTVSLHGGLTQVALNLNQALSDRHAGRLRGIGHIFEGLGCNPVVHDFLADMTWQSKVPDVSSWLRGYVERRDGRRCSKADEAWAILVRTVYSSPGPTRTLVCQRPALDLTSPGQQPEVGRAWKLLLAAAVELNDVDTYRFDLVNVTRQPAASPGRSTPTSWRPTAPAIARRCRGRTADAQPDRRPRRIARHSSGFDLLPVARRQFFSVGVGAHRLEDGNDVQLPS